MPLLCHLPRCWILYSNYFWYYKSNPNSSNTYWIFFFPFLGVSLILLFLRGKNLDCDPKSYGLTFRNRSKNTVSGDSRFLLSNSSSCGRSDKSEELTSFQVAMVRLLIYKPLMLYFCCSKSKLIVQQMSSTGGELIK